LKLNFENITWMLFGTFMLVLLFSQFVSPIIPGGYLSQNIIVCIFSIFVIMKSAGFLLNAISSYARKTGISDYIIGFFVVSIGTSLPELSTAFIASVSGYGKLVMGNMIGASIINVTIVLGLVAIVGRKVKLKGKVMKKTAIATICMILLPLILGLNGVFSRLDGFLLVISYTIYLVFLAHKEKGVGKVKKQVAWKDIWKDMFVFLGCLIALLLSSRWLVISSVRVADALHIPTFIVGLLLVSIGTTIPEITLGIHSILKKAKDIAFGNVLGSIVVNISLIIGLTALIEPIHFNVASFIIPALFLLTSAFIGTVFLSKSEITWDEGIGLLLLYATFVVVTILSI